MSSRRMSPVTLLRAVLCAALVVGSVLQMRMGLADNGDFSRIMTWISSGPVGFAENWPAEGTPDYDLRFWNHSLAYWSLDMPLRSRWVSAVMLLWIPGIAVNMIAHAPDELWLPWLSLGARLFMCAMLLLLFRWIDRTLPDRRLRMTLIVGLPFTLYAVNSDTVAYFTSMYQEPGVLAAVFVTLAVVWHLRLRVPDMCGALIAAAAALLVGTAKISMLYWPVLLLPAVMPWYTLRSRPRIAAAYITGVLVLPLVVTLLMASLVGSRRDNAYQSLYCGALTFSDQPAAHLTQLSLDGTERYIREPAYTPTAREFITTHPQACSHMNTLRVIVAEPMIAWRMHVFAADSMQRMTLRHLGSDLLDNYRTAARPWRVVQATGSERSGPLALWSTIKRLAFPRGQSLLVTLAVMIVGFGAIALLARGTVRGELARLGLLAASACGIDIWLQIFGDGRQDLIKHLFLGNLLFDIAIVLAVAVLVAGPARLQRPTTT